MKKKSRNPYVLPVVVLCMLLLASCTFGGGLEKRPGEETLPTNAPTEIVTEAPTNAPTDPPTEPASPYDLTPTPTEETLPKGIQWDITFWNDPWTSAHEADPELYRELNDSLAAVTGECTFPLDSNARLIQYAEAICPVLVQYGILRDDARPSLGYGCDKGYLILTYLPDWSSASGEYGAGRAVFAEQETGDIFMIEDEFGNKMLPDGTSLKEPWPEVTPSPKGTELTQEQIDLVNESLGSDILFPRGGNWGHQNPRNLFVTCFYETPQDIDLGTLMRNFPAGLYGELGYLSYEDPEALALPKANNYPADLGDPFCGALPINRFPAAMVDQVMKHYTGVSLYEMPSREALVYSPEYDRYYNFVSDFAAPSFHCEGGKVFTDRVELYGQSGYLVVAGGMEEYRTGSSVLTLKKQGQRYLFWSYLPSD